MFDDRETRPWISLGPLIAIGTQCLLWPRILLAALLSALLFQLKDQIKEKPLLKKHILITILAIVTSIRMTHPNLLNAPFVLNSPRQVSMIATLCNLPAIHRHYVSCEVCSQRINGKKIKKHFLLYWPRPFPHLIAGSTWHLPVMLKPPHHLSNPGTAPQIKHWAERRYIAGTGSIQRRGEKQCLHKPDAWNMLYIRQKAQELLHKKLSGKKNRSLIMALTLGDKRGISTVLSTRFQQLGISHLLALSGMHLGFLCGMLYVSASWLWRRFETLCLLCPAPHAAGFFMLIFGLMYILLVGAPPSAARAWLMLALWRISQLAGWHWPIEIIVLFSFNVFLIVSPFLLYDPGFWLSYAAVFVLISTPNTYRLTAKHHLIYLGIMWFKTQAKIWLFMLPICLYFFNQYSLISPISNAIAIPVVTLIALPLCLIGMLTLILPLPLCANLSSLCFSLADKTLSLLMTLLTPLNQPFFSIHYMPHDLSDVLLATLAAGFTLLPHSLPYLNLAILLMMPFILPTASALKWAEAKITALDVGQGLSIAIKTQHHLVLFDTGMRFEHDKDRAKEVIVPYLASLHRHTIDALIISHEDLDHRGGADTLIKRQKNLTIYANAGSFPFLPNHTILCRPSADFYFDGVGFHFLTPLNRSFKSSNNHSCVLQIQTPFGNALIPGDIERPAEEALMARYDKRLQSNLLIAAHHGSKTSSSEAWIDTVKPKSVIFATGMWNRFHFPHPLIVNRYKQRHIKMHNTNTGAITYWLRQNSKPT
jgi:competence protein ComEC